MKFMSNTSRKDLPLHEPFGLDKTDTFPAGLAHWSRIKMPDRSSRYTMVGYLDGRWLMGTVHCCLEKICSRAEDETRRKIAAGHG